MGLVIITGDGPEHRYVANALSQVHDVEAILVCQPVPPRPWKKVLKAYPGRFVSKALRHLFLRLIRDAETRRASLQRILGEASEEFIHAERIRHVGLPKSGELARVVASLNPEVLAIYGTGIIPDEVLTLARTVALNMHTGLSPEYRGVACAYWPIHDARPNMVGATVHECTSHVDGGLIYYRASATLLPDDDLHAIFARAVMAGADCYVKAVADAFSGILVGTPQDLREGQEFRGSQLGIVSEVRTRMSLRRLRRLNLLGS